jgi:hypothetical protein
MTLAPKEFYTYIYIIGVEGQPLKIGHAVDHKARLAEIQVGNPHKVSVLYTLRVHRDDVRAIEKHSHYLLRSVHLRGEWFNVSLAMARSMVERADAAFRNGEELHQISRKYEARPQRLEHILSRSGRITSPAGSTKEEKVHLRRITLAIASELTDGEERRRLMRERRGMMQAIKGRHYRKRYGLTEGAPP